MYIKVFDCFIMIYFIKKKIIAADRGKVSNFIIFGFPTPAEIKTKLRMNKVILASKIRRKLFF